jgi:hypothetical protein
MAASTIALIGFVVLIVILLGFALMVFLKIISGEINLSQIVCEPDGKASLSRFQFLIFTFVVAGLFLLLTIESGGFVEIPETVLGLLGISGGSFVVSKAVGGQKSGPREDDNRSKENGKPSKEDDKRSKEPKQ